MYTPFQFVVSQVVIVCPFIWTEMVFGLMTLGVSSNSPASVMLVRTSAALKLVMGQVCVPGSPLVSESDSEY